MPFKKKSSADESQHPLCELTITIYKDIKLKEPCRLSSPTEENPSNHSYRGLLNHGSETLILEENPFSTIPAKKELDKANLLEGIVKGFT